MSRCNSDLMTSKQEKLSENILAMSREEIQYVLFLYMGMEDDNIDAFWGAARKLRTSGAI